MAVAVGQRTSSRLRLWTSPWLAAIVRPGVPTYRALAESERRHRARVAVLRVFGSALLAGGLVSVVPPAGQSRPPADVALAIATAAFAFLAVLVWAGFAASVHAVGRLSRGQGRYGTLLYVSAAFHAPLMVLASVVAMLPYDRVLLAGAYLYWLVLYVLAVRATYGLRWLAASVAVFAPLVLLAGALTGLGLLVASDVL